MTDENMTIFDDYEIPDEAREAPETEAALITVTSLPEIEENLRALRERWQLGLFVLFPQLDKFGRSLADLYR